MATKTQKKSKGKKAKKSTPKTKAKTKTKKSKKSKVVDVEVVDIKEKKAKNESEEKSIKPVDEIIDQATKDLAEHAVEHAEDLMFKYMSEANKKKYKLNASTNEIEDHLEIANEKINTSRADFAIAMLRLINRQAWKELNTGHNAVDYFAIFHKIDWSQAVRYARAAQLLVALEKDVTTISKYYYGRLAKYWKFFVSGIATKKDFELDEDKMLLTPSNPVNLMKEKDFDQYLKQRFATAVAELKAAEEGENPDEVERRYGFSVKAWQADQIDETYRIAVKRAGQEGREQPSQGDHFYQMAQSWMAEHDLDEARAARLLKAYESAFGIALLPFPIHKHDKLPEGVTGLSLYEHKGTFCIEESKKHASKFFGCKVDEVKLKVANVTHLLERTGVMDQITKEEKSKAEKVLKTDKKEKTGSKKKKGAKKTKAKQEKKAKEDKASEKKARRISDLTDKEVVEKIAEYRDRLGLSAEDLAEFNASGRKLLKTLVVKARGLNK